MRNYFKRRELTGGPLRKASTRSKTLTTVPRLLQKDLATLSNFDRTNYFGKKKNTLSKDDELTTLRNKAQNRRNWRIAVEKIKSAAELKWNRKERERLARKAETEAEAARTRSRAQADADRPNTRRHTTLRELEI